MADVDRPSSEPALLASSARPGLYPGAKAAAGVAHRIIGQMPPHRHYVEAFVGSGVILRLKRPAAGGSVAIDVDAGVCARCRSTFARNDVTVLHGNAVRILPSLPTVLDPDTLIYCDPPYLREVRGKQKRRMWACEFWTEVEHRQLLLMLLALPCRVMISGYASPLYATVLEARREWRYIDYGVMTRGGRKIERLWCNFPEPAVLHDPRFGGGGYRERERVSRKRKRWAAKFARMSPWERQLIRDALDSVDGPAAGPGEGPIVDSDGGGRPRRVWRERISRTGPSIVTRAPG